MPNAPAVDFEALITQLRATGRDELVHYAGAAHRDAFARQLCTEYLADPAATEEQLKARTRAVAYPAVATSPAAVLPVEGELDGSLPLESQAKESADLNTFIQTGVWPS
jgi:hypothetical protein